MADNAKVIKLRDTPDQAAYLLCNASDGTGESGVTKIDISAIAMAATRVRIKKLYWACDGMQAILLFDHNTDDTAIICAGNGRMQEDQDAPIIDPASAGGTGDILLTTAGQTAGDGYTIYIEIAKVA